MKQAREL